MEVKNGGSKNEDTGENCRRTPGRLNLIQVPWVKRQFIQKLNIDPYPGTLNLEVVDPESIQTFSESKSTPGVEMDPSFCTAQCYPILIHARLKGAIVLPRVKEYPEDKMEVIASQNIKEALSAKKGDVLEVEIL